MSQHYEIKADLPEQLRRLQCAFFARCSNSLMLKIGLGGFNPLQCSQLVLRAVINASRVCSARKRFDALGEVNNSVRTTANKIPVYDGCHGERDCIRTELVEVDRQRETCWRRLARPDCHCTQVEKAIQRLKEALPE